jgi:hypothetical protein
MTKISKPVRVARTALLASAGLWIALPAQAQAQTAPATDPVYRAPTGAFATVVRCSQSTITQGPVNLGWTLSYNSRGKH